MVGEQITLEEQLRETLEEEHQWPRYSPHVLESKVRSPSLVKRIVKNGHADCPLCSRRIRPYEYRITASMAGLLVVMNWLYTKYPYAEPIYYKDLRKLCDYFRVGYTDKLGILQHMGLVESVPARYSKNRKKKVNGCWRITNLGMQFASGKIKVPAAIVMYDNTCLGRLDDDWVSIDGAMKNRFDMWIKGNQIDWSRLVPGVDLYGDSHNKM
jgi:hypothetical protein